MSMQGLLLAAGIVFLATSSAPTASPTSELTAPFVQAACGTCKWCIAGHKAPAGGSDIQSLHDWCMELAECTGHPGCAVTLSAPSLTERERLLETIEGAIRGETRALLALAGNRAVRWNESRAALQVEGDCDESVAAHIPVRREIAEALGLHTAVGDEG